MLLLRQLLCTEMLLLLAVPEVTVLVSALECGAPVVPPLYHVCHFSLSTSCILPLQVWTRFWLPSL